MIINEKQATIEAVLFTMGKSVNVNELALLIEEDEATTIQLTRELIEKYEAEHRGIRIIELDHAFQMCTSPSQYDAIIKLTHQPKKHVLTDVMLETLAIIAYKQPVTRAVVEQIRGVSSDHAINKLIEYDLVCESGRLDAPGKPILFGTTETFLRTFGFRSSEDMPMIDPVKIEELKTEAEEEANATLSIDV